MEKVIPSLFRQSLQKNRKELNSIFETFRLRQPTLDGNVFLQRLEGALNTIAETQVNPGDPEKVLFIIYRKLLEIEAAGLFSPRQGLDYFQLLLGFLKNFPNAFRDDPEGFVSSCVNAMWSMAQRSVDDVNLWKDRMIELSTCAPDCATFREAGAICAWLCGMAHFRKAALDILNRWKKSNDKRKIDIIRVLLSRDFAGAETNIELLANDPWCGRKTIIALGLATGKEDCLFFTVCGDFAGFGGVFATPPIINGVRKRTHMESERIVIVSGDAQYVLYADCMGHFICNSETHPFGELFPVVKFAPLSLERMELSSGGRAYPLKAARSLIGGDILPSVLRLPVRTICMTDRVIVFTSPLSHRVFMFFLSEGSGG